MIREPKEACELIEKIEKDLQKRIVDKDTMALALSQNALLLKAAAEGTEDDVRSILMAQEIQNRLSDHILLFCGGLSKALSEAEEESDCWKTLTKLGRITLS